MKVGDTYYIPCTIVAIDNDSTIAYPVTVELQETEDRFLFTLDGKAYTTSTKPTLIPDTHPEILKLLYAAERELTQLNDLYKERRLSCSTFYKERRVIHQHITEYMFRQYLQKDPVGPLTKFEVGMGVIHDGMYGKIISINETMTPDLPILAQFGEARIPFTAEGAHAICQEIVLFRTPFYVGAKVQWDNHTGEVVGVHINNKYPILVEDDIEKGHWCFTPDGRWHSSEEPILQLI